MNKSIFNGDTEAAHADRIGIYSGAAIGTVASVATLVTVGAGPAGLAAIGATVGGGMAAGAIAVLAAPVVAAGAVGGAFYLFFKE